MKQLKFLSLAIMAMIMLRSLSCGKSDIAPRKSTASWHKGSTAYTASYVSRTTGSMYAQAADGVSNCSVFLSSLPTSAPDAGTNYKIVGYDKMGQLASDECIIEVVTSATEMYVSNATTGSTMNLKIDNDKMTIVVPSVWATHYVSYGAQSDSVKIDANFAE